MSSMKAAVFRGTNTLTLEERPIPVPGPGDAVIRITTTTICRTDVHIVRGELPVRPGLVLGHVPVGVVSALGAGLTDEYFVGQRVLSGAVTPCGRCFYCLNGVPSQCGGDAGAWRFGNTIDGSWAEYLLVPDARANLAAIPDDLTDDEVVLVPHVLSAGLAGAEDGHVRIGDAVAIFAQGPIGLCATLGAKLRGASLIIAVDSLPGRLEVARHFGADVLIDPQQQDPVAAIRRLTGGRGVDVAIEALGREQTFEDALRAMRPGGTLSSLGLYAGKVTARREAMQAGGADQRIVITLCPGGKERMRRLMAMISARRIDLRPLVTHFFTLDHIVEAFELVASRSDNVLKVAVSPIRLRPKADRRAPAATAA